MKKLDFNPHKTKKDFRKNYKLHDVAEKIGKNLLVQWGIDFEDFGQDKRYERLWEKGKDKPDVLLKINNKKILLDWKSKHKSLWLLNKRAYEAYREWSDKLSMKVVIAFFVLDEHNNLRQRKFAIINEHKSKESEGKQWDKNKTIQFTDPLPNFTKANLLKYLW